MLAEPGSQLLGDLVWLAHEHAFPARHDADAACLAPLVPLATGVTCWLGDREHRFVGHPDFFGISPHGVAVGREDGALARDRVERVARRN
jgi:hypothetical protein